MAKKLPWLVLMLLVAPCLRADSIEKIEIEGNRKVSRETIQFYMKSREGGVYDPDKLKEDLQSLWATGFFENIRIEEENGSGGKVVRLVVAENPLIASVTYKLGRKVKESDINEKLQTANITLQPFSYYSPAKVRRVKKIITDMLLEKGYNQAEVAVDEKVEEGGQVALTVRADAGYKTRIADVVFPGLGRGTVSAGYLSRGLKNNQAHAILSAVTSKDVYNREKIGEDIEEVRLRLQSKGYLEAKVGTPEFETVERRTIFGRAQKMLRLRIPVELGPRYRVGSVTVEGNKVIRTDFLRSLVRFKKGDVYDIKKRNKFIEGMQKFYGGIGYFYAQVVPSENLDPEKRVADLTIHVQENDIVYLGKLEFTGNTYTKDHVIRREWFLREGKRLNINALEDSIKRMKQLGLVTIEKMPEIKPDPQDPQKINVTAEVKEMNRQMINFNVGYSGYEGWFVAAGYSTQNFLGAGETFTLSLQQGTRARNYQFAFTEPYLFNLPANFGIDIFKTTYEYYSMYTRKGQGFSLSSSARFWTYWGAQLAYSMEDVEISDVNPNYEYITSYYAYYYSAGKRRISGLAPAVYYSTVDSPIFPTSGSKLLASYRYSGGFLGGDVFLHKVKLELVHFQPLWMRHTLGLHLAYEGLAPFSNRAVPFYEKFFLGGERSIRGFETYTIGPRDKKGNILGGTKSLLFNLEYAIPLTQQFSFVFFYDMGNAYDAGMPIRLKDVYTSTGVELKVFVPMLNVPFRLIFAYNPRVLRNTDAHWVFKFAVGPSFY
ncbi:MAG TPA: outer membrane protein assembly factor BamA [Candidatus Aminicenantes bacterium]|nr:outer membrane protein assembly factor BamA [Candidatus Aminicenantes bacterium]